MSVIMNPTTCPEGPGGPGAVVDNATVEVVRHDGRVAMETAAPGSFSA